MTCVWEYRGRKSDGRFWLKTPVEWASDWRMPDFPLTPRSRLRPQQASTRRTREADWWVLSWSTIKSHPASESVSIVCAIWLAKSYSVRVGSNEGATTCPCATVSVSNQAAGSMTDIFKLLECYFARLHGMVGSGPFPSGDAGHSRRY